MSCAELGSIGNDEDHASFSGHKFELKLGHAKCTKAAKTEMSTTTTKKKPEDQTMSKWHWSESSTSSLASFGSPDQVHKISGSLPSHSNELHVRHHTPPILTKVNETALQLQQVVNKGIVTER